MLMHQNTFDDESTMIKVMDCNNKRAIIYSDLYRHMVSPGHKKVIHLFIQ